MYLCVFMCTGSANISVCIILHVSVGNRVLGIISNIMCVDTCVYVCMFVRACARVYVCV